MNKQEMITELSSKTKMTGAAAGRFLNAFIETVSDALAQGDVVQLIGFGTFSTRERAARTARNPKDGTTISVPGKVVPAFKAGKALKDSVNK